ncbi:hypothetical protein H5368_11215 [Luteimonas sp. MC1782]|uniref:hypothetical protein n=1 Tax=Luteimonas sp. MC1782 TaxID=2760305 RepID=UPI0015FFCE66|nr:hypothetical protein [Luteimonas sp. MC1782]MBB1473605.1 hypothetical protein [Luteimonas sp. MC1782]
MNVFAPSLIGGLLLAAVLPSANAAIEDLQIQSNATGLCQGALPVMDNNLRKRPLAVVNQGTSDAYVSCAFTTIMAQSGAGTIPSDEVVRWFGVFFGSSVAAPQTVSCAGVIGYEGSPDLQYVSLEVDVSSGTPGSNYLYFYPDDADPEQTDFHQLTSLSCRLPPGVSIGDTYVGIRMDDA